MAETMGAGWVDITSATSCDKCGRDNQVEVTVWSHTNCGDLLCTDCAQEWERDQQPPMSRTAARRAAEEATRATIVVDQPAADALAMRMVAQGRERGGKVTVARATDALDLQMLTQQAVYTGRCAGTLADGRRWVLAVRYSGVYDLRLGCS